MKVTFPGWLGWVEEMPEDEDKEEKVSIIEKCFMEITDIYAEKYVCGHLSTWMKKMVTIQKIT
jgi:hypothetical protein